jgi:serine O-acetyltransferase
LPHLALLGLADRKGLAKADIKRWASISLGGGKPGGRASAFVELMTFYPEYRNLFYHRIGGLASPFKWLCPPVSTLFINTRDIGPGLFIQHGFATIIVAGSIGADCWINQQVTIGYSAKDDTAPTIGNNVIINAGAKVIGNVRIGDNSIVGANAVVVKDVPANVTVVGVPAYIVKRDGKRVNEKL